VGELKAEIKKALKVRKILIPQCWLIVDLIFYLTIIYYYAPIIPFVIINASKPLFPGTDKTTEVSCLDE
jgi:hypothetical protein